MTKKAVLGTWLSFADKSKPRGQMFVGCIVVRAKEPSAAVARVIELGLWPKFPGSCHNLDVDIVATDLSDYSPNDIERMLTEEDAERLGERVVTRSH